MPELPNPTGLLLLQVLRREVDPSDAQLAALVSLAEQHGLSAVLERHLLTSTTSLPSAIRKRLSYQRHAVAAAGIRNKVLLFRALEALAVRGVVPVVLKGYAFAARYYPDPLLRPSIDIDLLVHRDDLPVVGNALETLGLSRYDDPREGMEGYHHHIAFAGAAGQIEVHFRLMSGFGLRPGEEGLSRASISVPIDGRHLRVLRPEEELVYLAVHAAQHLFMRFGWLYDLKLFFARTSVDWPRVAHLSRLSGMTSVVYAALHALKITFGPAVPLGVRVPAPPRWQRALIHGVLTEDRLASGALANHKAHRWLAHAALSDGPVRMMRDAMDAVLLKSRRLDRAISRRLRAPGTGTSRQ